MLNPGTAPARVVADETGPGGGGRVALVWSAECGGGEARRGWAAYGGGVTCRALWAATRTGPVRLIVPFGGRLVHAPADEGWPESLAGRSDGRPWTDISPTSVVA